MTYIPVEEVAEEYRQTGRWLMDRAEWEFDRGDLVQASEKAWGAAAQFLKVLATQRGWGHESHQHLGQVADKLAAETGNPEISILFDRAESLHANFYEAYRSEASVRLGIDAMQHSTSTSWRPSLRPKHALALVTKRRGPSTERERTRPQSPPSSPTPDTGRTQ